MRHHFSLLGDALVRDHEVLELNLHTSRPAGMNKYLFQPKYLSLQASGQEQIFVPTQIFVLAGQRARTNIWSKQKVEWCRVICLPISAGSRLDHLPNLPPASGA
jgi:hypothetical protein